MGVDLDVISCRSNVKYQSEQFVTEVISVLARQIKDRQVPLA